MSEEIRPLLPVNDRGRDGQWEFITWLPIRLRELYVYGLDRQWVYLGEIFFTVFLQLLVAASVSTCVLNVKSVAEFFNSTWFGPIVYVLIILIVPIAMCLLYYNKKSIILLMIFILAFGSTFGLICAFSKSGNVVQQTLIVTTGAFAGLTLYAFLASTTPITRNMDVAFLWGTVLIISLFVVTQKCHLWPWLLLGGLNFTEVTLGAVTAIVFCGYITWGLAISFGRAQSPIWGSVLLYLDVFLILWPVVKLVLDLVAPRRR